MHLVSRTPKTSEEISETIKKQIQLLSQIERTPSSDLDHINSEIGYNLILTQEYLMTVPLIDSYRIYDQHPLYLDGLAYIGVVHLARVVSPFSVKKPEVPKALECLIKCSGSVELA